MAATARTTRDLDLAEESAADAFAVALSAWERDGVPRAPVAWLTTTARRRALDALRRREVLRRKLPLLLVEDDPPGPSSGSTGDEGAATLPDDRLRLVFTCCHPALSREAQVGLTLRLVCGLSTAEAARALLVSEATMAARITRAKHKIAAARIPYRVPRAAELPERLDAVLTVVHLVATSGHVASAGDGLRRPDLAERALHLARTLVALLPDEREARGLLALLLLTEARRDARVDAAGRLVLLEDQDRSLWDGALVAEGVALVHQALRGGRPGRFALQAAIAALHDEAPSAAATDWAQVLDLYDLLLAVAPTPVVALNRAVAVAEVRGPAAGLAVVEELGADPRLRGYHYLPAVRADLLRRLGRPVESAAAFRSALAQVSNAVERDFLERRLAGVEAEAEADAGGRAPTPDQAQDQAEARVAGRSTAAP